MEGQTRSKQDITPCFTLEEADLTGPREDIYRVAPSHFVPSGKNDPRQMTGALYHSSEASLLSKGVHSNSSSRLLEGVNGKLGRVYSVRVIVEIDLVLLTGTWLSKAYM